MDRVDITLPAESAEELLQVDAVQNVFQQHFILEY